MGLGFEHDPAPVRLLPLSLAVVCGWGQGSARKRKAAVLTTYLDTPTPACLTLTPIHMSDNCN